MAWPVGWDPAARKLQNSETETATSAQCRYAMPQGGTTVGSLLLLCKAAAASAPCGHALPQALWLSTASSVAGTCWLNVAAPCCMCHSVAARSGNRLLLQLFILAVCDRCKVQCMLGRYLLPCLTLLSHVLPLPARSSASWPLSFRLQAASARNRVATS
jgi:hypothetical protein